MCGWHRESYRHSLASRGIKTRAILNPVASLECYNPRLYEKNSYKQERSFIGSGLEVIDVSEVLNVVNEHIYEVNGRQDYEEGRLREYYHILKGLFNNFNMSYEDFEDVYKSGRSLFDLKAIYLFGSRVTGFWRSCSDIDVYIQIKSFPGIDDNDLNQMVAKIGNIIFDLRCEEGLDITTGIRDVKVDVPIISTTRPEVYYDDDRGFEVGPAILIWEAPS